MPVNRGTKAIGETSRADFFPYVNGAPFNLGSAGRFAVFPVGAIDVTWAPAPLP